MTGGAAAGRKFPARPVRTPGRAHGLSEAHSGRTPWRWPQCCRRWLLISASRPPHRPPLNSVAAVRAAAIPGRRTLNAAGAGQGLGSPASADARPAGGARSRGPLCSPAANTGREGGDPLAAPLPCPRTRSAVTFGEEKAQTGLRTGTIPFLVLRRGPTHIPRRPAPCRPSPWRVGGAALAG